jgi:hypothetical protein
MRYHAARMHKKAVRRARRERHRFTQRRGLGKSVKPSSRFVARYASAAHSRKRKAKAPHAHVVALRFPVRHEKPRAAIWPWLVLLMLVLPTTLNHYYFTRPQPNPGSAEALLALNDPATPARHEVLFSAPEKNLELRNWTTAIRTKASAHENSSAAKLEPLRVDSLALLAFDEETFETAPRPLRWERLIAVQAATLGAGIYGVNYMNGIFGGIAQPFKVGNDWSKDHFMGFDELLHLQGAYRLTQAVSGVYQWAGVRPRTAAWIGAATAATFMTTMEYIDGRRKNDEASYSDFAANFLGAGLALVKPRVAGLQDFDLRLSYRTPADPFDRKLMKRYDRMTHWLTYDLQRRWKLPLHLGLGYSVQRPGSPRANAQFFFGVGISPQALLKNVFPAAARPLSLLELYHFGNQVPINEAGMTRKGKKTAAR